VKKTLVLVFLLMFSTSLLFAQAKHVGRMTTTTEKSAIHTPSQDEPAGLAKIYSNLGKKKTDVYLDSDGWTVNGPNASGFNGTYQWFGMPFTPKSNSHVSQVQVAVEWVAGDNQVNLNLYTDSSGIPGTLIAGPVTVTNLGTFGTCCTLAVADFPSTAVTGGTQYWVVANTPTTGTGSDSWDAWAFVPNLYPQAFFNNNNGDWIGFDGATSAAAGAVFGPIP